MKSLLPFKVTASLAAVAIALVCMQHGALDKDAGVMFIGSVFTFLSGVITHTDKPDDPPPKT